MSRRARHGLTTTLTLFALSIVLAGTEFRGCAGTEPEPEPVVLPEVIGGCLVDGDCTSTDMCVRFECSFGACVEAGSLMDGDGDGFPASPCGDDCSDRDPRTFPGAAELCDGFDQDCDGLIDEDARGLATRLLADGLRATQVVGLVDDYAVVGLDGSSPGELRGYRLGASGGLGSTPVQLSDARTDAFAVARSGGSVVVALIAQPDGTPMRLALTPTFDALEPIGPATPIGAEQGATNIAITVVEGQEWVVFDAQSPEGGVRQRWLWRSGDAESLRELPILPDASAPAIANDGSNVVVTAGGNDLLFIAADGTDVATHAISGPFATGPLASAEGYVYVAYRDAFDHVLTRARASSVEAPITAPTGARTDDVSIFRAAPEVLVARVGGGTVRAWLLEADLRTYVATFGPGEVAIGGAPGRMSASSTDSGLDAILSSFEGQSEVAVLACGL